MNRRGFTLLEILLAVTILALLAGLVQGIYATVVKNRDQVEAETDATHAAAALAHRMADELAMAFWDANRPDATEMTVVAKAEGLSAMDFATRVPAVAGIRSGGDVRLSYELLRDVESGTEGVYVLRRVEHHDLASDSDREDLVYDWPGIRRFRVECYDGTLWLDAWKTVAGNPTPLPRAVRVDLAWLSNGAERSIRVSTPLYGAP